MDTCLACDLTAGRRPLPGGAVHRRGGWAVEHCVGPLGVGTLVVKPVRHVLGIDDLSDAEAAELGPLLRDSSRIVRELTGAEQVYHCLWSHSGGQPGHVHAVVQPVTRAQVETEGVYGPALQMAMFARGRTPDEAEVEVFAERARARFAALAGPRDSTVQPGGAR